MNLNRQRRLNCFCGMLMLFVNMGILTTTFPVYFPYFRELKGFSNTGVLLLTTTRSIFAISFMSLSDRYFGRFDIKAGVAAPFLVAALAFAIMAFAPSPVFFYLATSMLGFSYALGGMIPMSILLRRWYPEHSGTPIGIAATGSGIAGMILPVAITQLVERFGLSGAFLFHSGLILLCLVPLLLFTKNQPPESVRQISASQAAANHVHVPASPLSLLREQPILFLSMIIMGFMGFGPASAHSMLLRNAGHDMETISLLLSLFGFFLIPAKIVLGQFADRFGGKRMLIVFELINGISLVLFCFSAHLSFAGLVFIFLLFALGVSVSSVGISVIAADFSDAESYPSMLKNFQFTYALGGLLCSVIPGMIADLTGSYIPAYVMFTVLSGVMLVLLLGEYRKRGL